MPSPFFSARIPQDLFDRIQQHIIETGESKTQILIKALAAYVNHHAETQKSPATREVSMEMFASLEERVANVERLLQAPQKNVINADDTHSQIHSKHSATDTVISANNFDILPDYWLDTSTATPQTIIDNTDNRQNTDAIELDKTVLLLMPSASTRSSQDNNIGNGTKDIEPQQVELFDRPKGSIGPYSESRMANELGIDRNKLRKHAKRIEEGEITVDTPMEVMKKSQLYCVNYLGKTERRKLWTATLIAPNF